jgi:hypothetical protein
MSLTVRAALIVSAAVLAAGLMAFGPDNVNRVNAVTPLTGCAAVAPGDRP